MKIITSNNKKTVKISRKEWENIGKKAGWTKIAIVEKDPILEPIIEILNSWNQTLSNFLQSQSQNKSKFQKILSNMTNDWDRTLKVPMAKYLYGQLEPEDIRTFKGVLTSTNVIYACILRIAKATNINTKEYKIFSELELTNKVMKEKEQFYKDELWGGVFGHE